MENEGNGFVLQEMSDGVITINSAGELTYCNPQAMSMLGLSDSMPGHKLISLFVEDPVNEAFVQTLLDAVYKAEGNGLTAKKWSASGTAASSGNWRSVRVIQNRTGN
ncbi:MAG: PAS domain-containing protein [Lachnospiraceae bacterium]|jgi:PAS domain-containing protein|nr:PAS domain-containing protein [Lachnospiraceae bacterium]